MIYLKKLMKSLARPAIIIGICLILSLFSTALTHSLTTRQGPWGGLSSAAFFQPPTATPQAEDVSEIGSTDEIMFLGGLIVLIIVLPIFLQRKSWLPPQ